MKTNQSTKIITHVQKIRKIVLYLLNSSSTTNSIILLPLFVINTILSVFHTNLSLHVFYILSCRFHISHLYIFFLAEQSTWSESTSPDFVFDVLLFPVLLLCPIKLFRKLVFQISRSGFYHSGFGVLAFCVPSFLILLNAVLKDFLLKLRVHEKVFIKLQQKECVAIAWTFSSVWYSKLNMEKTVVFFFLKHVFWC